MHQKKPILEYAIHYLSRFPKTQKEMELQLLKKWYSEEEIQKAIKWLIRQRYLDDCLWTQAYLSSEVVKKGKPLNLIKKKLYQKGIAKDCIQKMIDELQEEMEEGQKQKVLTLIDKLKQKDLDGFEIIRKLLQKWYSYRLLQRILKED